MLARFPRLIRGLVLATIFAAVTPCIAAEKLTFNMSWLPQGSVGGVLIAKSKGFFADEGLDVAISRGYGGQRTVNEVDQGLFDVGYGDPISIILNRSNGGSTILVGAINTRWPAGLCYMESATRKPGKPSDLMGLVLGGGTGSPVQNVLPAWLKLNGLPASTIKILRMDPSVVNSALLEGRIDLSECWEGSSMPLLENLASKSGKTLGHLLYRDFGLDAYGNGFVVRGELVHDRPGALRKFLKASYRGYAYMADHPEESALAIVAQYPTLDKDIMLSQIKQTAAVITDPSSPNQRLGWLRADRMESTLKFAADAFGLPARLAAKDIYTNELLN